MANLTRDQRIIKENPTLTAYELLTQKNLSQDKYNELVQSNYQPIAIAVPPSNIMEGLVKPPQPIQPTVRRAEPKLSQARRQPANQTKMATLVNKTTKKQTRMTRASAEWMAKLDKNYIVR